MCAQDARRAPFNAAPGRAVTAGDTFHAKVAYQFRGIINELYLTDLKKKTHRGQMGQVLRGFSVGSRGHGYASVPDGEAKHDTKAASAPTASHTRTICYRAASNAVPAAVPSAS